MCQAGGRENSNGKERECTQKEKVVAWSHRLTTEGNEQAGGAKGYRRFGAV